MLKIIIKISIIAILCVPCFAEKDDLALLSMTLYSLSNRAHELGLHENRAFQKPQYAENLNQIIGALENRRHIVDHQALNNITQKINSLLTLIGNNYELKKDSISLHYKGFKLVSPIEQFANELLLIANIAEYISSSFQQGQSAKALSNTFNHPLLYLFLNELITHADRKLDLVIINGISLTDSESLKKKAKGTNISYFPNIERFWASSDATFVPNIYLLNLDIQIDNKINEAMCTHKIENKTTKIRIFPEKLETASSNTFLINSFAALDQGISKKIFHNFFADLIKQTKKGPQALKSQRIYDFMCQFERSKEKNLADIMALSQDQLQAKLFLFTNNNVISCDLNQSNLKDNINRYGVIVKMVTNLEGSIKNLNEALKNNMQFYKFDNVHKKFNKYKSINSINVSAKNLSAKT